MKNIIQLNNELTALLEQAKADDIGDTFIPINLAKLLAESGFDGKTLYYWHETCYNGTREDYTVTLKSSVIPDNHNFHGYAWRYSAITCNQLLELIEKQ